MAGYFELSKSSDGQFKFALKAGNHETILTSELYKTKAANHQIIGSSQMYASEASCGGGIESVKTNGKSTTVKDSTV